MQEGKVLIYSPSSNIWGGGQIYIEQLCVYMNKKGLATFIVTSEPKSFTCNTIKMGVTVSKLKRFSSVFKLARLHKKNAFNTIVLNDLASLWLAPIFRLYGYRVISLLHLYLQRKSENKLGHSSLEYFILKVAAKFCHQIFSVNKENQKVFGKVLVKFIGNYVPDWFVKKERVTKNKKYDFIIVARFAKQKNIPLFIDILGELIKRTSKRYTALIVGDGPEKNKVHKKVIGKNLETNVEYLEWIDRKELPTVFDQGKCFVISSYHEGFATTLLEAHARGLPAIVTKSAGFCAEFIDGYNASTGIVFVPDDLMNNQFYIQLAELIKNYESYGADCIEKSCIFSEENVLGPIFKAASILPLNRK